MHDTIPSPPRAPRFSTPAAERAKTVAIVAALAALINGPGFVKLITPREPEATRADVQRIDSKIDKHGEDMRSQLKDMARLERRLDESMRVLGSALELQGYKIRGLETGGVHWQSTNATAIVKETELPESAR